MSFRRSIITLAALAAAASFAAPLHAQSPTKKPAERVNPAHERAKMEAERSYQQGNYQRTIDLTATVIAENPKDHVAHYLRGSAKVELGLRNGDADLLREGIADARQAIALGGTTYPLYYLPYLYGMTSLSRLEERPEHAQVAVDVAGQVLKKASVKSSEKANLHYQRALAYQALNKLDEAIADFTEAIRISPSHLGAYVAAADAYAAAGETEKALEFYGKAVRAFPSNPLVYNNRGMYLQQLGRLEAAITDFTRALEIDKDYLYALTNRGYALMQSGRPAQAEADFSASLKVNPNQPAVFGMRGTAKLMRGDLEGALADHRRAVQLDPNNPNAHADLGFTFFFAERYETALKAFERAATLNEQMRFLEPWRYWSMVMIDKAAAAENQIAEVLKKTGEKRDWVDHLLAWLTGASEEKDLLEAVAKKDEEVRKAQLCEAHFFIALKHRKAGRTKLARQHFQQALETGANHLSAYRGSEVALRKLKLAEAKE